MTIIILTLVTFSYPQKISYKMIPVIRTSFLLTIALLIFSCDNDAEYRGDGQFVDHGPGSVNYRHVLDLGEIDLNSANQYSYDLVNLADTEFVIGLNFEYVHPILADKYQSNNARVELKVLDSNQRKVVHVKSSLKTWTSSISRSSPNSAYVYNRQTNYFKTNGKDYSVSLSILSPNTVSSQYKASLILKSRGWK